VDDVDVRATLSGVLRDGQIARLDQRFHVLLDRAVGQPGPLAQATHRRVAPPGIVSMIGQSEHDQPLGRTEGFALENGRHEFYAHVTPPTFINPLAIRRDWVIKRARRRSSNPHKPAVDPLRRSIASWQQAQA